MGFLIFRFISVVMIILFIISSIVQYNDPDPWLWIVAYLVAAAITVPPILRKDTALPIVASLVYLAWGAVLFRDYFGMEERTPFLVTEIAREGGGLFFTLAWMTVLSIRWLLVHGKNAGAES